MVAPSTWTDWDWRGGFRDRNHSSSSTHELSIMIEDPSLPSSVPVRDTIRAGRLAETEQAGGGGEAPSMAAGTSGPGHLLALLDLVLGIGWRKGSPRLCEAVNGKTDKRERDEAKRQSERNIDPDIRLSVPQSRLGHHGEDDHHGERASTSTSDASEAAPCPIRIECSGLVRRKRSARWLAVAVATSMEPNDRMHECSHSAGRDKQAARRELQLAVTRRGTAATLCRTHTHA